MQLITPVATMVIEMPVAPVIALALYFLAMTVIRRQVRVAQLARRGWRRSARGEMILDDEADVISATELFFAPWHRLADEHPSLQAPTRARRAAKGGVET